MAFQRGGVRSKGTATRLTGLFSTKRKGLYVGSLRTEDMAKLIAKIKEAKEASKGLTFFVWRNDGQQPALTLSVDLERDREERGGGGARNRPIGGGSRRAVDDDPFPDNDDSVFEDE